MGETYKDKGKNQVLKLSIKASTKWSKPDRPLNTSVCLEHNEYLEAWLSCESKIDHLILPREPGNVPFDSASALH